MPSEYTLNYSTRSHDRERIPDFTAPRPQIPTQMDTASGPADTWQSLTGINPDPHLSRSVKPLTGDCHRSSPQIGTGVRYAARSAGTLTGACRSEPASDCSGHSGTRPHDFCIDSSTVLLSPE
jgi:hypothetical protein